MSNATADVLDHLRDKQLMQEEFAAMCVSFSALTPPQVADLAMSLLSDGGLMTAVLENPRFLRRCAALTLARVIEWMDVTS